MDQTEEGGSKERGVGFVKILFRLITPNLWMKPLCMQRALQKETSLEDWGVSKGACSCKVKPTDIHFDIECVSDSEIRSVPDSCLGLSKRGGVWEKLCVGGKLPGSRHVPTVTDPEFKQPWFWKHGPVWNIPQVNMFLDKSCELDIHEWIWKGPPHSNRLSVPALCVDSRCLFITCTLCKYSGGLGDSNNSNTTDSRKSTSSSHLPHVAEKAYCNSKFSLFVCFFIMCYCCIYSFFFPRVAESREIDILQTVREHPSAYVYSNSFQAHH